MSTSPIPPAIVTYPGEEDYLHRDNDLAYVDALALDLARILTAGQVAEASYEPGDMTRYRVVIVPLSTVRAGQARVSPRGSVGNRHAVVGMKRPGGDDGGNGAAFYADHAYVLVIGERSYSTWLEPGGGAGIAPGYLAANFDLPPTSAVSVAILLRAICSHLETCVPADCTGWRGEDGFIGHDGDTCPVHEQGDREVFVVFDGPPSNESGRFVELETRDGHGVGGVNWEKVSSFTDHADTWRLGPLLLPERTDG